MPIRKPISEAQLLSFYHPKEEVTRLEGDPTPERTGEEEVDTKKQVSQRLLPTPSKARKVRFSSKNTKTKPHELASSHQKDKPIGEEKKLVKKMYPEKKKKKLKPLNLRKVKITPEAWKKADEQEEQEPQKEDDDK
jgi:hypothetical protein